MMNNLRAGVIGLRRGLNFVRLLRAMEGVDLVAVADLDYDLLGRVCREHGIPRGCASLAELLDTGLDVLVVATQVAQHAAQSITALERGVHVLSEVPAVATADECDLLIAAVERSGRHYMLAENGCYWAFVDTARQLHARGDFGAIFYAEAEYIHNLSRLRRDAAGRPTWRATLEPITYITHSLGPIISVTGQYPVETTCYGAAGHCEPGVTDVHTAIFRLAGGAVARITISFANAHWGHHRFAFFGTKASLDTGSVGQDEPKFWSPTLPNITRPVRLPVGRDFPGAPRAAALGGHGTAEWYMVDAFLRSIREGTRPPIDVHDAIMYSLPGLCALESARTGQPVTIPQYQGVRSLPSTPA